MRASRLLRLLLVLQNRGRQTCAQLSNDLGVARRTVLRDVDALTEAGLPVVVVRGPNGGIELGFNYRTRLTGLTAAEAEALGLILGAPVPGLDALGLEHAAKSARTKLLESLPDGVRETASHAQGMFRIAPRRPPREDPRVMPLAQAIRESRKVRIGMHTPSSRIIHPVALVLGRRGWAVCDDLSPHAPIPLDACGDLNISALRFVPRASSNTLQRSEKSGFDPKA